MTEFYVQPEVQFQDDFDLRNRPVHAEFGAYGEVTSTGISFDDYSRMQVRQRKVAGARRMAPPPYASNDAALRKVLVAYLERRAFSKKQRELLTPCSEIQAINRAEQLLRSRRKRSLEQTLSRLSHEYVALKKESGPMSLERCQAKAKRQKILETQIRNVDTTLRLNRSIAAVVAGVIYYYYRVGMDSVGVSSELGMTPIHARQLLKRVNDTWEEITETKIPRAERRTKER